MLGMYSVKWIELGKECDVIVDHNSLECLIGLLENAQFRFKVYQVSGAEIEQKDFSISKGYTRQKYTWWVDRGDFL